MIDASRLEAFVQSDQYEQCVKIIAKLLSCWCIPRAKNKECQLDYDFISRNRETIQDILELTGYALFVVAAVGKEMAYIQSPFSPTLVKMQKPECTVFYCLRLKYEENLKKVDLNNRTLVAELFVEDLLALVNAYKKVPMDLKTLYPLLLKLEAFNLIQMETTKRKFNTETIVTILPSITALVPTATVESIHMKLMEYKNESNKRVRASDIDETDFTKDNNKEEVLINYGSHRQEISGP